MAAKKMGSAKRKRFINNVIVHVFLSVLAIVWVFPIQFQGGKGFLCIYVSAAGIYDCELCQTIYGYDIVEFPQNVWEHPVHCNLFLYPCDFLYAVGFLLFIETAF